MGGQAAPPRTRAATLCVQVKLTSSISFKLISMAKNAAIVLLSVPVFHNQISPTQAATVCNKSCNRMQ